MRAGAGRVPKVSVPTDGADHRDLDLGRRILALEALLTTALARWPECEEALLATQLRAGRTRYAAVGQLEVALKIAGRTRADDPSLAVVRKHWDDAQALRWELAMSMHGVAKSQARRHRSWRGVHEDDLAQEGVLGLFAAAQRFEPDQNVRFSVYARWWVRSHLTQTVHLSRMVRLPASAQEMVRNLRAQARIREDEGRPCTITALAADLGVTVERATKVLAAAAHDTADPRDDEDLVDLVGQLEDVVGLNPEQATAVHEERTWLRELLEANLASRELQIMQRRYGIDQEPCTVVAIGTSMALSAERVRQLEHQSIAVLRDAGARRFFTGPASMRTTSSGTAPAQAVVS